MLKQIVHWLVFIAIAINLFTCVFMGQAPSFPEVPF